jgi:ABC-type lipoprotein export system ATPase subunit
MTTDMKTTQNTVHKPEFIQIVRCWPLSRLIGQYPIAEDFLFNLNLPSLDKNKTIADALLDAGEERLAEFGLTAGQIPGQLAEFLLTMTQDAKTAQHVSSLTILGGQNKLQEKETVSLLIRAGEVISIVGPTGSGKSRLLADIECLAQGDTPTKRTILVNGRTVNEDDRFELEGKMVAQLSQNMNFVMDLSVKEFLEMHARSRSVPTQDDAENTIGKCYECANSLAGEKFTPETKLTQLSGGQSRALMIADTAYISQSPIVLIDEIENAGVDRKEAVALLSKREKIVLISTHDPLLALSADKRIVIKNGGIFKVIETTPEEKESLVEIEDLDALLQRIRNKLRSGNNVLLDEKECGHVGIV